MLLLMMELKGRFNTKMIKKAKFGDVYFDEMGSFDSVERDRVTNTVSILPFSCPLILIFCRILGCCWEGSHFQADPRLGCATDAAYEDRADAAHLL